jgi:hypothetical protein
MRNTKTFAFDTDGNFLLARPSKEWAIKSINRKGVQAFLFSEQEVKNDKHLKFFKTLKKHSIPK